MYPSLTTYFIRPVPYPLKCDSLCLFSDMLAHTI
nr:MAG TPA: hypothetical protein [Crassvirales sp.]